MLLISQINAQNFSPNLTNIYNTENRPQVTIFHKNDSISTLICQISQENLNFVRTTGRNYEAKVQIKIKIYKDLENMHLEDTITKVISINQKDQTNLIQLSFEIPVKIKSGHMLIFIKDLYNNQTKVNFLEINKNKTSEQNFLINDSATNAAVFANMVNTKGKYYILSRYKERFYQIKYYDTTNDNKILSDNLQPDSIYEISSNQYVSFNKYGLYQICLKSSDSICTYVKCFGENFPKILTASEYLEVLKLLLSSIEYEELKESNNKKLALDYQWLKIGKNFTIAKKMLQIYYTRAQLANIYFTDIKKGWETDRGTFYILIGQPTRVNIYKDKEIWYYYNPYTNKQLKITFKKQYKNGIKYYEIEPLADVESYKQKAIKSWKEGEVYTFQ